MSQKSMRKQRARSRAAPNPYAIDYEPGHEKAKKQPQLQASTADKAVHKNRNINGTADSFSHSGDEADGDDDVGDEDEDEDEDDDGDVFAPSDATIEAVVDQTGLCDVEQSDSDDEVYNAVNDISDSDADEPEVERLEENDIIRSEEVNGPGKPATFSGPMSDASDIWEGFDLEDPFFASEMPYFDDGAEQFPSCFLDNQIDLSQADGAFAEAEPLPSLSQPLSSTRRRVHFDEPLFGASDSSVTGDEDLNALFNTGVIASTEADLDFDFAVVDNDVDDDGSSVGSSSGYETDYGDTTDEDDVPASATTRPQSLIRQPSPSSLNEGMPSAGPSSAPSPFKVPATPVRQISGPRMGSFKVDLTKPFAMVDSTGGNLLITPAKRPPRVDGTNSHVPSTRTSTAAASPTVSHHALATPLNDSDIDMSDFSSQLPTDPMLAAGSESMADIFFSMGPKSHTRNSSQASGDVFYPMEHMGGVHAVYAADDQDDDEDDNDDEDLLNVEDFIDFGVDTSDDDAGNDIDTSLPTPISTSPTAAHARPKVPSPNHLVAHDLMAHFDKGIAGVFRQGQDQKLQRSRRLSGGLSLSQQAFKKGRHAPANSPTSPPKKRKMSGGFAPMGSFGPAPKRRLMQHD